METKNQVIFRSKYLNFNIVLKNTSITVINGVPVVSKAISVRFIEGRVSVSEDVAKLMRENDDYKVKYFEIDPKIDKQVELPSNVVTGMTNSNQTVQAHKK